MGSGRAFWESVYVECLIFELRANGLSAELERRVPIVYRGEEIRTKLRVDLIVDDRLIVEIKAVDRLHPVHQAQVITYLKLTGCPAGLLFNFNGTSIRQGLQRFDHPDIYAMNHPGRHQ